MSKHGTENQFHATPEMEEIGLYYNGANLSNGGGCFFWKTSTGKFKPKKEHKNIGGTTYIRHKNSNYTEQNLFEHLLSNRPLKKGISSKYSPRKRKAKLSLFDRLVNWFRR